MAEPDQKGSEFTNKVIHFSLIRNLLVLTVFIAVIGANDCALVFASTSNAFDAPFEIDTSVESSQDENAGVENSIGILIVLLAITTLMVYKRRNRR